MAVTETIQKMQRERRERWRGLFTDRAVVTSDYWNRKRQVYDTDGNFLQRLDGIEMQVLLSEFLGRVAALPACREE
ncbi:hypothetical protein N7481_009427 [Penicillium waksmanii]|uniref:uncharacterized protein n=1 Tax=Penicillium waksmanii TaxID=69791 RepID=UPI0025476810|nr:uncharacterized protein N7481_009427 [Penicillium waksmanii]KAJ5975720.1 hypothetical protein N7481_009427 [Penicillium waksmanii]